MESGTGRLSARDDSARPATAEPLESALRKITRRLLPALMILYVIAFLDRVNLGYAKQEFLRETGFGEAAYAFGAGIFFVGYAICEVPSNLLLARVGARRWFARIMVTWGFVCAGMMFVESVRTFYFLRFLLGVAEAGFFPGVIYYLTRWYPPSERGPAMGLFYFGAPLAQILGGPLSGALLELRGTGGLGGWQWMLLVEGLLAVVAGLAVWRWLPDGPHAARWLSDAERAALHLPTGAASPTAHPSLRLPVAPTILFGGTYLLIQVSVYGVTFYLPTQVANLLGREAGVVVGMVSAIPWIFALAAAYVLPRLANATRSGGIVGAVALAGAALGIAFSTHATPAVGLTALCIATAGFIGCQPVFWGYATRAFGPAQAPAAIALVNSLGAAGGFLAPNLRAWAEQHWASPLAGVTALALATIAAAAGLILVSRRAWRTAPVEESPP